MHAISQEGEALAVLGAGWQRGFLLHAVHRRRYQGHHGLSELASAVPCCTPAAGTAGRELIFLRYAGPSPFACS